MNGLVVVNYNDYKNTISFIKSVSDFNCINYIVIVDNCSTDGSFDELKKICSDNVFLIKNVSNKGYGSGINLGSRFLIENYGVKNIIVSNTDIIIHSNDDIRKMLDYLDNDVALVGPTIIENNNFNRGWKIPSVWDDVLLNIPFIHRWLRKKLLFYKDSYYSSDFSIVEALSGCFFIVRSDVLVDVGFFDENIFLYYEENVIAVKLRNTHYLSFVINGVNVIHNHSVTIDNSIGRIKKFKILKKSQKYFHKNYSNCSIFGIFFLNLTYLFMLGFLYIDVFFHNLFKK